MHVFGVMCMRQVYRAEWNGTEQVAVKQLKSHDARNDIRFLREIAILKECRSTNVVQFLVSPCLSSRFAQGAFKQTVAYNH